jgi:general secretion pathway protein N
VTARRFALYGGVGIAIYLATLVATVPAPWASRAVERISGHKLQLREPTGSLWSGSGRLYATQRSGPQLELGELRWKTAWAGIFRGKLVTDVAFGNASRAMHVELSLSGVTVQGLDIALPARVLANFAPGLDTVGPQGTLRLRSDSLRLDADSILGLAEIEWRQVRLTRAPGLDLGSHIARLRGGGSKVDIELGTLEGPLRLTGKGTWDRESGLTLAGAAEHGAQAGTELAQFLRVMCPEYRNNRCGFRFRL